MADKRNDDGQTGGQPNHFPTIREFISSQIQLSRELTVQPLTDHTLHATRPIGALNLREKLLQIFQEESELACKNDPKFHAFTLKGRLSLTVNGSERIFIEINDNYPHSDIQDTCTGTQHDHQEKTVTQTSNLNHSMTCNLPNTTIESVLPTTGHYDIVNQTAAAATVSFDQSLIDRVTSLGQLELLRRYNESQVANLDIQTCDTSDGSETIDTRNNSEKMLNSTNNTHEIGESNSQQNTEVSQQPMNERKLMNGIEESPIPQEKHTNDNESQLPVTQGFKCYLCDDVLCDRMSLLLHVERHCQTLAQKCLEDKSPDMAYHLKDYGISIGDTNNFKLEADVKLQPPSDTTEKSVKKSKKKSTPKSQICEPIVYKDDIDNLDEEDYPIDSLSDDEENDPSFLEEMQDKTPPKRKRAPSTRSQSKSSSSNRRKLQVPKKTKESSELQIDGSQSERTPMIEEPLSQEEIPKLPPARKIKHTSVVLAPFKSRPVKTKATLKRRIVNAPKMNLKIRMKEKAKALAIKTANEMSFNPNLECIQCNKKFENRKAFNRHARRHTTKKCQCDICGKEFSTLDSLSHHQRGLHGNVKPYACEECGKTFSFHHSYKLHRQKHSGLRPHQCQHCTKSYLTSSHLKAHCTAVHSQAKKDKYICSICGKSFNYQNSLRTHSMIHTGERPHTCSLCQKGFVSRQALRTHEMSFHVTSKNYKCDICGKFYKSEMLCNVHKRRHTTDVSRFMCDICGRQFMFKSNLEAHKYVHQEGRPFGCDTCGKSFKCMSSLYTHQYTHKPDTPFLCKLCGKAFKTKNCCKAHERRHTAEKSFICSTCGSCFPDKGGLSKHIRTIHNPHKHFVCKLCNKVGTRADNMRTHVKSHGKDIGTENIENFIVEVLNPEGIPLTDQVVKIPNQNKQRYKTNTVSQSQVEQPPASTINYSQLDMYQPPVVALQGHHSQSHHHVSPQVDQSPHMIQQHFGSQGMVNLSHNAHSHTMTPPITQPNSSMTPPMTQSVTPTPQVTQPQSPPAGMMQMVPSYTTLHPLTTETMVMGGMSGHYPSLYAPYKHQ